MTSPNTVSQQKTVSIGTAAAQLDSPPLANRNYIEVQNAVPLTPTVVENAGTTAPAAGAVLADTGAIGTAGSYEFVIDAAADDDPDEPTIRAQGTSAAAPVAGTVIADTGAIATGGLYKFDIEVHSDDTAAAGKSIAIEHRDAANTANVREVRIPVPMHRTIVLLLSLAASERVRVINVALGAAGSIYNAYIEGRPVPSGKFIAIEHRNAANGANVGRWILPVPAEARKTYVLTIAASERVRVVSGAAAVARSTYTAAIQYRRLAYVFVGKSDVTTASGIRLGPGEKVELDTLGPVYAIGDGAAIDVRVRETGVA